MSPHYKEKKANKKQIRCQALINKECGIESSEEPTRFLAILNAGHCTGLTEERALTAASTHGVVVRLAILPNKSYCFLECESVIDAKRIFEGMHSRARIGQNDAVVFLGYCRQLPTSLESGWNKPLPSGLLVLDNFITSEEEAELLAAVNAEDAMAQPETDLKYRRVKHFGYEFNYDTNNVDPNSPLKQGIPKSCDCLWPRLRTALLNDYALKTDWEHPDQLTVNVYEPGQGIPPHVDTHSAFTDPVLSLSLLGNIVMDFRRGAERRSVLLRRRSLLVMSGESRYDWMHGITPRNQDVIPTQKGSLTTQLREKRISFTFRRLRRGPCECAYPTLCDSQIQLEKGENIESVPENAVLHLEETNVHNVYERIAPHFSETRHSPWPQVEEFLQSFPPGSLLFDVGCGNGKYMQCNLECLTIGCDRSSSLLSLALKRVRNVGRGDLFRCDCLNVPVRAESVDGCISIAVIHHLATAARRLAAIREMARILKTGGQALVYVWAKNQNNGSKKSSYLLQNKAINKQKTTIEDQRQQTIQQARQNNTDTALELPIHTNRTDFLQQDVLVPWKLKGKSMLELSASTTTYLRFYHVFEEMELEQLVRQVPEVKLLRSYYDQGNYCVIFQKK